LATFAAVTRQAPLRLSVSLPVAVKTPVVLVLGGLGAGAFLVAPPLLAAPVAVVGAYAALRLARHRVWLHDTVLCKRRAFTVKRIDLAHAHVWSTYVAAGGRPSALTARDPIQRRRMSLSLVTVGGRALPPDQIKSLHDAIVAGQRFRRGRAAQRAEELAKMLLSGWLSDETGAR
jgi:hypothetical protein